MPSRAGFWSVIVLIILASLYLISFGPVCYIADKLSLSRSSTAGKTLIGFFYPHFVFASHQEWYFTYVMWWTGKTNTHDQYLEFRKRFRREPIEASP